ncbi:MAG: 4Fe-4S dicluster domain-containing protein [Elusimicrobia bacterium]|nr:4Fe-4S dicluster domain-containing protein [Elusimicrobiota bacterium]
MVTDRRGFLKLAGLTAMTAILGKFTGNAARALAAPLRRASGTESGPEALAGQGLSDKAPKNAKRLAMVVDLEKCRKKAQCRDCIIACHQEHNVPQMTDPKDEVKWIWKEEFSHVFHEQEHEFLQENYRHTPVPLLCNHCEKPACVKVCPTKATWKRESDGIVMMDWHRCIGCRYCMAACPYGSRSFNWRDPRPFIKNLNQEFPTRTRGVVEKCTFCERRLAQGKQPACVQACKAKALIFGDLNDPQSDARKALGAKYSLRRKPGLGTGPKVYYLL